MAFNKKTWKDRLVEFAGRRTLSNVSTGEDMVVDVTRNEGNVLQTGDAFSAANMNDLEQRIADEFTTLNNDLGGLSFYEDEDGNKYVVGADSVPKKLGSKNIHIYNWSVSTSQYTKTIDLSDLSEYNNLKIGENIFVGFNNTNVSVTNTGNRGSAYNNVSYSNGNLTITTHLSNNGSIGCSANLFAIVIE